MESEVVISGGGIAGLTLALKLVTEGVRVTVLEKHAQESILYKGELLQPKSIAILEQLGLATELAASSWNIPRTLILEGASCVSPPTKDNAYSLEYGVLPTPYNYALMIPHDKLKQIVLDRAMATGLLHVLKPAHIVRFGKQHDAAIISHEGVEDVVRAPLFIGAEGKFSTFRTQMNIAVKKQNYNHQFLTVTIDRPPTLTDATVISKQASFIGLFPLPDNQVRTVLLLRAGQFKQMKQIGIRAFHQAYRELAPFLGDYVERLEDWKQIQLMIPLRQEARQYVSGNRAILGDAAHSVHPMAGEGMNMAIQDADVLGSLLAWMVRTGRIEQGKPVDEQTLRWFERIRKPRAQFVSAVSHLSALAYSFPLRPAHTLRAHILGRIAGNPYLMLQYMVNISGLGMAPESLADRVRQLGLWPFSRFTDRLSTPIHWFTEETDFPWLHGRV